MGDFEVVELGTIREIQLSRNLAREIQQTLDQFGLVFPSNVMKAFDQLRMHYESVHRTI